MYTDQICAYHIRHIISLNNLLPIILKTDWFYFWSRVSPWTCNPSINCSSVIHEFPVPQVLESWGCTPLVIFLTWILESKLRACAHTAGTVCPEPSLSPSLWVYYLVLISYLRPLLSDICSWHVYWYSCSSWSWIISSFTVNLPCLSAPASKASWNCFRVYLLIIYDISILISTVVYSAHFISWYPDISGPHSYV